MRITRGGLRLAVALLLTACTALPSAATPEEAALLADFHRAAYGAVRPVLGTDGAPRPRGDHLAKWEIPIEVALIGGDGYGAATREHLSELARLTGLEIREAVPAEANLLIIFAKDPFAAARQHRGLYVHRISNPPSFDALLARMEQSATCFGLLWGGWPSGRSIDFSVVFIRTGRGERTVRGCLVQETTQVLGLLHDLDPAADSVFSDSGRQIGLTDRDRLLLRLLYDPRLKPGMAWAEAEPLVRAALHNLLSRAVVSGQQPAAPPAGR